MHDRALAKARKNSATSSKPPSSDIVKPPKTSKPEANSKRKKEGQPGHPRHQRTAFTPEQLTATHEYHLDACPGCDGLLEPAARTPRVIQQIEIVETPVRIDEHRGLAYWCGRCQKVHYAALPSEVEKGGLIGPQLTALVAYLKGVCHASFSTIRKFFRDVLGVTISRGQLRKLIGKVSDALADAYAQLLAELPNESYLNVDETGHKDNGDRYWTWCFRAETYVPKHTCFQNRRRTWLPGSFRCFRREVFRRSGLRLLFRLPQVHEDL